MRFELRSVAAGSTFVGGDRARRALAFGAALLAHLGLAVTSLATTTGSVVCPTRLVSDLVFVDAVAEPPPPTPRPDPPPHRALRTRRALPSTRPAGRTSPDAAAADRVPSPEDASAREPASVDPGPRALGVATDVSPPSGLLVAPANPSEVSFAPTSGTPLGAARGHGTTNAPTAGPAHDPRPHQRAYAERLRAHVGAPRYTLALRRRGIEGTVHVGITVDPNGRVTNVRIRRSSGDAELDALALAHARSQLANLPSPPPECAWRTREVPLAFEFAMRDD